MMFFFFFCLEDNLIVIMGGFEPLMFLLETLGVVYQLSYKLLANQDAYFNCYLHHKILCLSLFFKLMFELLRVNFPFVGARIMAGFESSPPHLIIGDFIS